MSNSLPRVLLIQCLVKVTVQAVGCIIHLYMLRDELQIPEYLGGYLEHRRGLNSYDFSNSIYSAVLTSRIAA
jgi:hypothetical protein